MSGALQKGVRGALQVVRPRSVISHPEIGEEDRSKDKTKESAPDRFNADEDACSKLWAVYVGEAEKYDGELVSGWKDDMSDLVVFSSLYSAVLTAFIIESYQTLQQDPADLTVDLLTQIAMQLVAASNGTAVTFQPPDEFQPDPSSVACNLLWFLALALALTCSLLAIFVQQWTRDFKHKTSLRPSPVLRAKIFMFSYFGMRKFGMHAVIDLIPFLLHLSLILFFIGLVEFLAPVNGAVKYLMACFLGVFGLVYLLFTFLPIIRLDAPFRTPLSNIFWSSGNAFGRWLQRVHGLRVDENFNLTESALEKSYNDDADGHDQKAMTFTIKSLTDDSELLPFIEALPDAINGSGVFRHSNVSLLAPSIMSSNPSLNIIAHITAFTDNPSAWLDEKLGIRCLTAYPQAVWSLAQTFTESIPIAAFDLTKVWFPEAIANKLLDIESITEAAQNHSATSALALVRSTQIRSLQSRFALIESKLSDLSLERGDDRDVMMDLCRDVTSFDWNEKILDTFSRFHASLQSRATGDSYKNVLKELDSREWANAQIYALGEFLTHSIGIKNHYMLFETYNYLSQAVADSLKNVELFVWDDNLVGSLCKPIQQIANLQYRDSLSDQLFILTLRHFHWDKRWASSVALEAVRYRKAFQEQYLRSFDPAIVAEADAGSQLLEICFLSDLGNRRGDPDKYLPAIWLFIYCLLRKGTSQDRYSLFAGRILKAFRKSGESCPIPVKRSSHRLPPLPPLPPYSGHLQHPLYRLIQALAGSVVCMDIITLLNLQNFVPPELIPQHDHDDLLETVKALGREFLPERREFDDFFYLPENVEPNDEEKALVERFCHYVKSIHLALVASYIKACNEPFEEVRPFREGAFGIVYGNFFRWRRPGPHIDKSSQLQFAQCISEFLANDTPTPDTSRSNIFWMILDQSFGNYTWITYPEAAEILLQVLQRKESGSASKNVQKEALCNHCRNILTDNQEMKMDSEETWI